MRNKLILKVQIILIFTILGVAVSGYFIFYSLSYNSILKDIRERSYNVKYFVQDYLTTESFADMEDGDHFSLLPQGTRSELLEIANLKHLYLVKTNELGKIFVVTSGSYDANDIKQALTEKMESDIKLCLESKAAVGGDDIYHTAHGSIYTIYWPVLNKDNAVQGAVGMEFNVDSIYNTYQQTKIYNLALSGALILFFCLVTYLTLRKVSEPFYKKLAYTDILTGVENRMAYDQRLTECERQIAAGKNVTLMMFDVNNLKTINDTLGHKYGDQYIVNTSKLIIEALKGYGNLYRVGGDEFAAVIVGRRDGEINEILKALSQEKREVIRGQPFSCACGAAAFMPGYDTSLLDVAARADKAMYNEKSRQKQGRLKVV